MCSVDEHRSHHHIYRPEKHTVIRMFTGLQVIYTLVLKEKLHTVQSSIPSGKNILQELLSRELTTMRHVSFIQNLDNLDAYLYSDRQSSNFLNNEVQSNLNLLRNGSYTAKSIEGSYYKQGRTFSFIKQLLKKIIQFLPCHVLVLSFRRILNHIEHFIEERCSYYSLSMDTPCLQDGRCNLLSPCR